MREIISHNHIRKMYIFAQIMLVKYDKWTKYQSNMEIP